MTKEKIRIATFNCENLFLRFKFTENIKRNQKKLNNIIQNGFIIDKKYVTRLVEAEKKLTAQAIRATNADIIALQEVENMDALKKFNTDYLKTAGYTYKMLIDANDPRLIDVALLSRIPIDSVVSHQHLKNGSRTVFSRDCLEVRFLLGKNKTPLTLFINHFKSMIGGRTQTQLRRKQQSEAVVTILKNRFGNNPGGKNWIVLGDLNDYLPSNALQPLVDNPWIENVIERIPDINQRWTHWWDKENQYRQLDYLLLSRSLAHKNINAIPEIVRNGLAKNATKYTGARFPGIGKTKPSASDHCPVVIELEV